jgi:hypothetical protein
MTACSEENEWTVHIGQNGKLDSGAKYTAVMDSPDSFSKWLDAEIAHDQYGKTELAASNKAYLVPSGARVLVLEWDHMNKSGQSIPISKVRLLDGQYTGIAGWAAASQVHPIQ